MCTIVSFSHETKPNRRTFSKIFHFIYQNVFIHFRKFYAHIPKNIYKKYYACACLFSLILINVDQMNLSFMLMMFLSGNCMPRVTYIML